MQKLTWLALSHMHKKFDIPFNINDEKKKKQFITWVEYKITLDLWL